MPARKQVWVATPYGKGGEGGIDRLNDAIFDALDKRPDLNVTTTRLVTRGKRGLVIAQGVFALALARLVVAGVLKRIDLLHIHLSGRGSVYRKVIVGLVAKALRIPYIVHLHDFRAPWDGLNAPMRRRLDALYDGSAGVVVLGRHWADIVRARLPAIESKLTILPNATRAVGMQKDRAKCAAGPVMITFLGQLGARKGTPQLVAALSRLAHLRNWSATLAGDGDIEVTRQHIRAESISHRVEIPGWLGVEATNELLVKTDILVLPSFAENLPMVIVEAFAHGAVVVATPVGAVPEVITHETNGLLVPAGDVEALAAAMERLITNPGLRRNLGSAAQQRHAERYELGRYVGDLADVWHRAMEAA